MNSKVIAIVAVILLVLGGGAYILSQNNATTTTTTDMAAGTSEESQLTPTTTQSSSSGEMDETNVKEFTVNGDNFTFDVKEMRVKKGDTVRVTFNNTEGFHDWVLDEFDVATKQLQAGGTETIEFVVDKTGEFEYYCSIGTHRQMGMKGTLIVE